MRILFWSAFAAFLIDQASKYLVVHLWELWRVREIDVLPPYLNFRYGENRGINFGLFGDGSDASRYILIGLALTICLAVVVWIGRGKFGTKERFCAGLLIGGALANVVDRLVYGYVLDFLNNSLPNWNNPFVYNIADVFIFAGAIGLILFGEDGRKTSGKAGAKTGKKAK
ncbi:signal peptidase II [Sulfitobacter sp. M57]|uniref:signal peptidase II n=1 Tax=unclassified Sulfitobacter TaxID=196795 RepID=UPI0023E0E47B|nr:MULTISPECIES: signal peptidase II [unclassified Sulfitobacter]MDF3415388.1 signal peptidase II [Sulfitobacter sp. KE5]MDF3422869.1 signal peptidase II [Sulfitobacter sp. KE43]MDF3433934.1 signal peptidase II [Sulfitobacter sp. KE42]MDF3459574.1 signal peptidase II [Sulfitobacter sp. S74]MDF3463473.1 signal peptidase II [Sulfitobacter sp. Ks18]